MKKFISIVVIIFAFLMVLVYMRFFASTTRFSGKEKFVYIPSKGASKEALIARLQRDSMVKNPESFEWLANKMGYWEKIIPGKYKVTSGESIFDIIKTLRSGKQAPVRLVINKLRLPEDFCRLLGRNIETDSATIMALLSEGQFSGNGEVNRENLLGFVLPNTYEVMWTWSANKVFDKIKDHHDAWWNKEGRLDKAAAKGLTQLEVHTLASIVEEETNKSSEKPTIASVYLNRIAQGMPLQADPTVRFALKDFSRNRVYYKQLRYPSPYNTYVVRGLPPGPICTATTEGLNAVLDAPKTDYIFFVANADLRGGHTFTSNLADHSKVARVYQDSLNAWLERRAAKNKALQDSTR